MIQIGNPLTTNSAKKYLDLKRKVILITGSSRGIGRAIALESARSGADIAITYNNQANCAESVATEICKMGSKTLILQVDVSSRVSVQKMISRTLKKFGRIDVLVNNAGILQQKPFLEITDEDWERMIDINLKGAFICSQEVFSVMQKQEDGIIVNMASSGGQLGGPLAVHYSVSKAGIICFTKSLARIGAPYGIRANCIAPGLIDTEMTQDEIHSEAGQEKIKQIPIQRAGSAKEIAQMVVFLSSEKSAYMTGQTINVNGGLYMG